MCEICKHWPRGIGENPAYANLKSARGVPLLPNHHPNCPHYNDSLMDVYKVTVGGISAYNEHLQDAKDTAGTEDENEATIECVKMHREVFEYLPEFDGF